MKPTMIDLSKRRPRSVQVYFLTEEELRVDLTPTGMLPCDIDRLARESDRLALLENVLPLSRPRRRARRLAMAALVAAALAAIFFCAGCCAVTVEDVDRLEAAIMDERKAVVPRKGFEAAVLVERAGVDAKLAAMEEAHK